MNKNIKRIISLAIALGTVSAVAPATNANLLTTKAYAATTTDTNSEERLSRLELETSSGGTIKLYSDSKYDDKVDSDEVSRGDTYYAKTSSSTISINTGGPKTKFVKVFKGTSGSTKGKSEGSDISISSGTTIIVVKVYDKEPGNSVRYDDDDDVVSKYTIKVKHTGSDSSSDDNADDYDDIYLEELNVDGKKISLSESKVLYTYSVANSVSEVTIKAVPEYEDDVTINGYDVDDDDNYKRKVSLKTGENKIKIEVEDDDDNDNRVYTLNITRASATTTSSTSAATTTPSTATNVVTTTVKASQWVQVNGKWQYNDALGTTLKNQWFLDRTLGKWYFLGMDGSMQTGWMLNAGKYYYLNTDGSMASNTTINGYKVGNDGAWII